MRPLLRLLRLAGPQWPWLLLSVALAAVTTLANVGLMAVSGWFVTAMGIAGLGHTTINYLMPAAIIRSLALLRTGGRYAERLVSHEATLRLLAALRTRLFASLVPLVPLPEGGRSSDLAARLASDVDRLELVFLRLVSPLAVAILTAVAVCCAVAVFSPRAAFALGILLLSAMLIVPLLAGRRGARAAADAAAQGDGLRRRLIDDLDGLAPLLLSGTWDAERATLLRRMDELLATERALAGVGALGQSGVSLIADLAPPVLLLVVLGFAGTQVLAGPELAMILLAAIASFEAFGGLPDAFAGLSGSIASARRIFDLIDRTPQIREPEHPVALSTRDDIVFDAVTLRYPGREAAALDSFSLAVPFGTHLAILGESGAGKSSLGQLLLRLADPSSGRITLGGTDLRDLATDDLRGRIVGVPQSAYLLSSTVGANLRLGRPDASPEMLAQAIRIAGLAPVLARLPQGLETPIGTAAARLSGGEARRLAIARALVVDPPVLILDEPGEGLDPETERALLSALVTQRRNRTLIVITHHAVGIELMDEVVVMKNGRCDNQPQR